MRNKFFHKPLFHHEHSLHEKKASWLELFYDLIYVASFIQLGNTFSNHIDMATFGKTFLIFLSFWVSWSGYTYYSNRYTIDDFLHRILVFAHMFCIGSMTVVLPNVFRGDYLAFSIIYGLSQLIIALLYVRVSLQQKIGTQYTHFWGSVFFVSGLIWFVSCFVPQFYVLPVWVLGSCAVILSPYLKKAQLLAIEFPFDHEHLAERYGLLTIIVLGESFVKVLTELVSMDSGISLLGQACFTLLLTCSIWWIYFDDVADSHLKKNNLSMPLWLMAHIPLQLAIIIIGIGVKKAIVADFNSPLYFKYAILLTFAIATVLIATSLIDLVTKRKNSEITNNTRVNLRFFSGVLLILIGLTSQSFSNFTLLLLALLVTVAQIIIDVAFSPYQVTEDDYKEAVKISSASLTVENAKKYTSLDPIRKGVPNDLKKDLYYSFINSSWLVIILCIFLVYILSNLFFAFLYILATKDLGAEAMSFSEAFFFSVQTMSTIGYGVLSPKGLYANLLVTVEAAFGLISVAMVTGAIFNKISKPNSKLLFSKNAIISDFNGEKFLSFRVGNAVGSDIIEAKMNLSVAMDETTKEGEHIRRVYDLKLERDQSSFFKLSWSLFHKIDETSPLYGKDLSGEAFQSIIATLTGHDGTYSSTVFSRQAYFPEDICTDRYFADVIHRMSDGRLMVDYDKFHDLK